MLSQNDDVVSLSGGEVVMWVDPGAALHLKCITSTGDPVELNADELRELILILDRFLKDVE